MTRIPDDEPKQDDPFLNAAAKAAGDGATKILPRPKAMRPSAKLSALDLMYTYYDRGGRE